MQTKIATACSVGDANDAAASIARELRAKLAGEQPALVVTFASTSQPLNRLVAKLESEFRGATCIGASTAGEFTEERDSKGSAVAFALAGDYRIFGGIGTGLGANPEAAVGRAIEGLPRQLHGYPYRTALLLLDPLSGNGEEGAFLLRYEAGLAAGSAYKIRAPLSRGSDDSISFACGVPEGSVIRITESEPERQVASAREAAKRARAQLGAQRPAGALVFDCICRNLILQKDFGRAVQGIVDELGGVPLAGFETYGEIALDAGDMSGFHNTTSVVLAFPE